MNQISWLWLQVAVTALILVAGGVLWLMQRRQAQDVNTVTAPRDADETAVFEPPPAPIIEADAPDADEADPEGAALAEALATHWELPSPAGPGESGYNVMLLDAGVRPVLTVRLLRHMRPDLDLEEAMAAIEGEGPFRVFRNLPVAYAEEVRAALDGVGARVELR